VLGLTVGVPGAGYDADLGAELRRALREPGFDVLVDRSANLGATAEHRAGPHAGTPNLAYVTGLAGVSAGLIVDGHVVRGARGHAGALGRIELDGDRFDRKVTLSRLIARVRGAAAPDAPIADHAPELARIAADAKQGRALGELAAVGRDLGGGLAVLADLVNPEVIVLGAPWAALAPWVLPAAAAEFAARVGAAEAGGARVVASTLGPGAVAAGGAWRALAAVESGRLPRLG
jgi:predicted NBD/HSP70 family sugar kinase